MVLKDNKNILLTKNKKVMANRFLTLEEFGKLRNEITLNSLFARDYLNSFEIDPTYVRELFDGYISYREEEIDIDISENKYYGQSCQ